MASSTSVPAPRRTRGARSAKPGEYAAARRSMERALGDDFPNIKVLTRSEFRDQQLAPWTSSSPCLVALLALSAIIAILGIVNTLALSVFERTRELGLLRVVGMSRREIRRMVRWESVVIAVVGAVVGRRPRGAVGLGVRPRASGPGAQRVPDSRRGRCSSSWSHPSSRASSPRCSRRGVLRASTCSKRLRPNDR